MFEDGESDESVPVSDEMKAYDDKLFRFAVYNKITAPNSSDDLGVGSDESSDIVDIPINSNANLDDEELIKISEKQIDDAMAAVEDGEFDISQDDLPSDEATDEVDPNADKVDRQQSLEFEYENVEHTLNGKEQHEINEATIPSGAPVWTGNVHATQFTPTSAPLVSTAPTKEEWGHPSDQEAEPAEIVAVCITCSKCILNLIIEPFRTSKYIQTRATLENGDLSKRRQMMKYGMKWKKQNIIEISAVPRTGPVILPIKDFTAIEQPT